MCEGDPDEWEKVIKVNMLAPMRLMRRLTPAMVEKGEGVIINIDSSAGLSPKPGNAVYSSSKSVFSHCYASAVYWAHQLPHVSQRSVDLHTGAAKSAKLSMLW